MKIDQFAQLKKHAELSHFRGKMKNPDLELSGANTLCGDQIEVQLKLKNKLIIDAKFEHKGCVLSSASASIMLGNTIGKNIESIKKFSPQKLIEMLGGNITPARVPCALLPLAVFKSKEK